MPIAKTPFPTTVGASPNKAFFVNMLTRDIELNDAILDLLDNCVDGIVRSAPSKANSKKPYAGFYAHITLTPEKFVIEDNCGGIPLKLAIEKAFHLGNPRASSDGAATVGMYGIGMKRAIFKLGRSSVVRSRHGSDAFEVSISNEWLNDPKDWNLPIRKLPLSQFPLNGTAIEIKDLRPEIGRRFDENKDAFINDFSNFVAQHYAIILQKGFKVTINKKTVPTKPFELLCNPSKSIFSPRGGIAPYVMQGVIDGVHLTVAVGFYRPPPSETEVENEQQERHSKDDAGWTIVCNDRVVVYRDRTRLTGWGEAGVPNYHSQFIAITGIVVMQSNDLWKLPLTTTKRNIDSSSDTYSVAKDYMREGIKYFTKFTNRWKELPDERKALYKAAEPFSLEEILSTIPAEKRGSVRAGSKGLAHATRYAPTLPVPENTLKDVRISFSRPKDQVRALAMRFFDDVETAPGDVGAKCFDIAIAKGSSK